MRLAVAREAASKSPLAFHEYNAESTALRSLILENAVASGTVFGRLPVTHHHRILLSGLGNSFAAVSEDALGQKYFEKCVSSSNVETIFWHTWRSDLIEIFGEFYRLNPPIAMAEHGEMVLMVFPFMEGVIEEAALASRQFDRLAADIARAVGEFSARHSAVPAALSVRKPVAEQKSAIPERNALAAALRVSAATADEMLADQRTIDDAWPRVMEELPSLRKALSHRDLAYGNVIFSPTEAPAIIDWGSAGEDYLGSDLCGIMRWASSCRGNEVGRKRLVSSFVEGARASGLSVPPEEIEIVMLASFSAKYRNIRWRSARNPAVFRQALDVGLELARRNRKKETRVKLKWDPVKGTELHASADYKPWQLRKGRNITEKVDAVKMALSKADGVQSVLDIGCNAGVVSRALAKDGYFCIGIDTEINFKGIDDPLDGVMLGHRHFDDDFVSKMPKMDAALLLSVHHHFIRTIGNDATKKMIGNLAKKIDKVMVFEVSSKSTEYGQEKNGFFRDENEESIIAFTKDWLEDACPGWRAEYSWKNHRRPRLSNRYLVSIYRA